MSLKFWVVAVAIFLFSFSAFAYLNDNRPEYQKEYDAYMRDLSIIAQTGKAPVNLNLEADLAKMDSDDKIRLTSRRIDNVPTMSSKFFGEDVIVTAQLNVKAEVVNSVEIIRVPEEFRDKYSKEYNSAVSAQDLADTQNYQKKKMIDEDAAKIAEHVNPFRFLSEVKLSKLPGDYGTKELPLNPMVDAYFNQFGRPYVAEEPQDVIKETKKVKSKEERSSYKGLSLRNSMFVY